MIFLKEQDEEGELRLQRDEADLKKRFYKDMIDILERKVDFLQDADKDVTSVLDSINGYEDKIRDLDRKISNITREIADLD